MLSANSNDFFPLWGPYGKKYMGISRIGDKDGSEGVRFDLTASPAVFASCLRLPNVTLPSGCRAWKCAEDYSFYSYRFDLENRDDVYAYVNYVKTGDEEILLRTEFFNNTDLIQNCILNLFASAEYRTPFTTGLIKPEKSLFIKADNYEEYSYAVKRPWDEQMPDAMKKGVFTDGEFTGGTGLGDRCPKWHMPHKVLLPFGGEKGDQVSYKTENFPSFKNPVLLIRYKTVGIEYRQGLQVGVKNTKGEKDALFTLNGDQTLRLPASDTLTTAPFHIDRVPERIELVSEGEGAAEFDFLLICEAEDEKDVKVIREKRKYRPEISEEFTDEGAFITLKYGDMGEFRIRTFNKNTRTRNIDTGCLEDCLGVRLSNEDESFDDVLESFTSAFKDKHSDEGFFHDTLVHTLFVEPHSSRTEYAVISKGETEYKTAEEYEKIFREKYEKASSFNLNGAGEKYRLSGDLLRSALLTNVVYPIYKHGSYIIHHTPGKRWDCLYTWDSGFIALGLMGVNPNIGEHILEEYLSDKDNPDYAFVHHGSPVPVQFYVFNELMNTGNERYYAEKYYDRLKLYYDFYLGRIRGSTTAKFKSGLLTTYDYFYSSSGMDDYPAQVAMMKDNLRDKAAPVITSAQAIRIGKIMRYAACLIGKDEDAEEYKKDAESLTKALNLYSWNKDSGYFSYVLHDEKYEPAERYLKGEEDINRGLDGVYPLVSGICTKEQEERLLEHLKNGSEMNSPYGISAVDKSASYFKVNGYWNGHIWFPHQWFLFKSMLDMAQADFAFETANKALNIWKRETEHSYYTFEMVSVITGRGGWFHNFGALSSPVNMWLRSYYEKCRVTTGFDTHVKECEFNNEGTQARIKIKKTALRQSVMIVTLSDEKEYAVFINGEKARFMSRIPGETEITLPEGIYEAEIIVK